MSHKAADLAALGKTVVIAFPNKNLLNEKYDNLKKLISTPERIIHDTEIYRLKLEDNVSSRLLLKRFFKGNSIIVTLHAYLVPKGDFKNHLS